MYRFTNFFTIFFNFLVVDFDLRCLLHKLSLTLQARQRSRFRMRLTLFEANSQRFGVHSMKIDWNKKRAGWKEKFFSTKESVCVCCVIRCKKNVRRNHMPYGSNTMANLIQHDSEHLHQWQWKIKTSDWPIVCTLLSICFFVVKQICHNDKKLDQLEWIRACQSGRKNKLAKYGAEMKITGQKGKLIPNQMTLGNNPIWERNAHNLKRILSMCNTISMPALKRIRWPIGQLFGQPGNGHGIDRLNF